jgi:hypothetical protein
MPISTSKARGPRKGQIALARAAQPAQADSTPQTPLALSKASPKSKTPNFLYPSGSQTGKLCS